MLRVSAQIEHQNERVRLQRQPFSGGADQIDHTEALLVSSTSIAALPGSTSATTLKPIWKPKKSPAKRAQATWEAHHRLTDMELKAPARC